MNGFQLRKFGIKKKFFPLYGGTRDGMEKK